MSSTVDPEVLTDRQASFLKTLRKQYKELYGEEITTPATTKAEGSDLIQYLQKKIAEKQTDAPPELKSFDPDIDKWLSRFRAVWTTAKPAERMMMQGIARNIKIRSKKGYDKPISGNEEDFLQRLERAKNAPPPQPKSEDESEDYYYGHAGGPLGPPPEEIP